ncbi:MAG: hypothetical protein AAGC56_09640 [Pseudomonadota bacterium]
MMRLLFARPVVVSAFATFITFSLSANAGSPLSIRDAIENFSNDLYLVNEQGLVAKINITDISEKDNSTWPRVKFDCDVVFTTRPIEDVVRAGEISETPKYCGGGTISLYKISFTLKKVNIYEGGVLDYVTINFRPDSPGDTSPWPTTNEKHDCLIFRVKTSHVRDGCVKWSTGAEKGPTVVVGLEFAKKLAMRN